MTEIIGKDIWEAQRHLAEQGKVMRVIERDGKGTGVFTTDYWENRINVRVQEGKVAAIAYVG